MRVLNTSNNFKEENTLNHLINLAVREFLMCLSTKASQTRCTLIRGAPVKYPEILTFTTFCLVWVLNYTFFLKEF